MPKHCVKCGRFTNARFCARCAKSICAKVMNEFLGRLSPKRRKEVVELILNDFRRS